ncbi:MAG: hypothetical protein ACREOU_01275 [Candidatus Eiseniibacteriota bacterium]
MRTSRVVLRTLFASLLGMAVVGPAAADPPNSPDSSATRYRPQTWTDHDARPIREPEEREKNLMGHQFREAVVEPLSHAFDIPDKLLWLVDAFGADTEEEGANVNKFDEVPNSSWFTNRNHVRALTSDEIRKGPIGSDLRPVPPYTIKSYKKSGVNPGFNIKDAADKRWVVKLDPPSHPQLGSGADAVVSRLLYAAGYNLPHDVPFTFRRDELEIDDDLAKGVEGDPPLTAALLDSMLVRGAVKDGKHYAQASLFLEGTPIGHIDMRGRRPDDPNDLHSHKNRRELRGLYVLMSWLGSWDTKDHQSLDTFIENGEDSTGYVRHHLLDVGAALGAAAEGPKAVPYGYENRIDWGWTMRRLFSLGFATEPWRRTEQVTGIPSVGNFESDVYEPQKFKPLQPHPAFRERTDRDDYWGAKIVASFSDVQIEAAIDAAGYEDPRAKPLLLDLLKRRRDKVARYWFGVVAPLDYFHVDGSVLRFRDLAVDRKLEGPRSYEARIDSREGHLETDHLLLQENALVLDQLGAEPTHIVLELAIAGRDAKPATVELRKENGAWKVASVSHG